MTDIPGLDPPQPQHELTVSVQCNEENVAPLDVRGRGCIVIVFGAENDGRAYTPVLHNVNEVELYGAAEILHRLADNIWAQALDQQDELDEQDDEGQGDG